MRLITKSVTPSQTVPAALDPRLYLDPAVLELEYERVLERSWQLAGHVGDLPEPGTYITTRCGTQEVLVVRDDEGEIRAFRNVCRHRGSRLLDGSGQCPKAIRCRYHGWTYRLDGDLIGVPEGRTIAGLDKSTLGLYPARAEVLEGLVFVNIDPDAEPLADQVRGLAERLAPYGIERLVPRSGKPTSQPANWKIVVDNYLEGYHVPIAHPGLMRLLDYKHYDVELHDGWVWFEAPMRDKPSGNRLERAYQRFAAPMPGLPPEHHRIWRYVFIYPNTTIDLYPDQVLTWRIDPAGMGATEDMYASYRPASTSARSRTAQWLNDRVNQVVGDEDVELVRNQQLGVRTREFKPGPLSGREAAVGWFAEHIRRDLAEAADA